MIGSELQDAQDQQVERALQQLCFVHSRLSSRAVSLDANELKFGADGSLTLHLSHVEPGDPDARANWLPAPDGQFALIVRTYVPTEALLNGTYKLPNVERR